MGWRRVRPAPVSAKMGRVGPWPPPPGRPRAGTRASEAGRDPERRTLTRRHFLTVSAGLLAAPWPAAVGAGDVTAQPSRRLTYDIRFGILFGIFTINLAGTVVQELDPSTGRYRVVLAGEGAGVRNRAEAVGRLREGRFLPLSSRSAHTVRGRESTVAVDYDHDRGLIEYHAVAYTFLLGRRRQVDDVIRMPPGRPIDDLASASLNFAAGRLERAADGGYQTWIVRRARPRDEGPDDVAAQGYRAEVIPVHLRPFLDQASGRLTALVDVAGFTSWARPGQPARVVFGPTRLLESLACPLILGSSMNIRVMDGAALATRS